MASRCLLILAVSLTLVNADDCLNYCTPHIRSCCDLRASSPTNGMYTIGLGTFAFARVYCDMTTSDRGWIVIQRNRLNSQLSFYKNWKEYEDGFGDLEGDFWAGLKLMNHLTQRGQWEIKVDFQNDDHTWSYLHYNQFSVGSTSEEYPLTVTGYTGISGDYFTTGNEPAINARFTTYDNDNDVASVNCANNYRSGWWFYSCFDINPNYAAVLKILPYYAQYYAKQELFSVYCTDYIQVCVNMSLHITDNINFRQIVIIECKYEWYQSLP